MKMNRYPRTDIISDYLRGSVGLLLTAGPLLIVPVTAVATTILGSFAMLFAIFIARTAVRQKTVVSLNANEIQTQGLTTKSIEWAALTQLHLRYFAVKRDRSQGWMQLILKDGKTAMRFDSTLVGFDEITSAAYKAAERNDLVLSPSTMENLGARGIVKIFQTPSDLVT
ncbi:MAG: hypothetical protein CMM52_16775 [Rhodospirillaceae bacterium]|nr:hypothetical protein [Rhodospirillaceae bacterium]|tara:strand:- start:44052 stop:44558 length:507 start_codon:yes stop_codon:yes gene_type:complete